MLPAEQISREMSKRLFVGNLPYQVDDASLLRAFESQGFQVASARVVLDRETGRSRGFAFVDFDSDDAAKAALEKMNGSEIEGRPMRVTEAEDRRPPRPGGPGGPGGGGGGGGPMRPRPGGPPPSGPRVGGGGPSGGGGGGAGAGPGRPMRRRGDDDDRRRGPDRDLGPKKRKGRTGEDDTEDRSRRGFDYDDEY